MAAVHPLNTEPAPGGPHPPPWHWRVLHCLTRLSLAQQLILLAVLPATVATLAAIAVLTRQHLDNVMELMRANAQTVALQVATVAQGPLVQMDRRALLRIAQSGTYQPHVQQVQIWSDDGEIVANSETADRSRTEGLQVVVPVPADDGRRAGQVMVEISLDAVERARRSVGINVSLVLAAALFAAAALLGMELVFSQRLQLVMGMSPLEAALFILPLSLAAFIAGPLAGWLLGRVNSSTMLFVSLLVSGLGMTGYLLSYDAALLPQMVSLCVLGAGIGATMTAASSTIMQSATPERAGMAASIEEVSYELGGALGVTLMGSILSGVYAHTLAVPAGLPQSDMARDSLDQALIVADGLSSDLGMALTRLAKTAFDTGYAAVIATAAAMLLVTAGFVLLNRRRMAA